jgi:uncharacterized protein (DUF1697 family)
LSGTAFPRSVRSAFRSPLAAALGKLPLRGAVTTRNWNTVLALLGLLSER